MDTKDDPTEHGEKIGKWLMLLSVLDTSFSQCRSCQQKVSS